MMLTPHAPRHLPLILLAMGLYLPALADGPAFELPTDGAAVRGEVVIRATKANLDGGNEGYVSYRIAPRGARAEKIPFAAAVIWPFEYTWDTQETYWNPQDVKDPRNGSRKYPDGVYTITAAAFNRNGEAVGDPTTITVTVSNNITPSADAVDAEGRVFLRPGGHRGEELHYTAEASLTAQLAPEEIDRLTEPIIPPMVQMRGAAEWYNTTLKPFSLSHTSEGWRWHGQLLDEGAAAPDTLANFIAWDRAHYAVRDEHVTAGWVELLGRTSEQMYDAWRDSSGGLYVAPIGGDLSGLAGTGGGGVGAGMGGGSMSGPGMAGGAAGIAPGGDMGMGGPGAGAGPAGMGPGGAAGMSPGGGTGMSGAGMAGGGGAGGAVAPGWDVDRSRSLFGGMPGRAANTASSGNQPGQRNALLLPVNMPGLGRKYRSVVSHLGTVEKLQIHDPRWPLAELWTQLPPNPVRVGDSWLGDLTIMPFFDQQYHIRVPGGGGGASYGPHHMTPLFNRYYSGVGPESVNIGYGPGNGPVVNVLDGFEYYRGYECARIVSRFRNYPEFEPWARHHKTGWWLSDLSAYVFGPGGGNGPNADQYPLVRTDLVRVTYFAYRSGHIVGIEDHYRHQIWMDYNAFTSLASIRRTQGTLEPVPAPRELPGPGATAGPGAGGMMGANAGPTGGTGMLTGGPGPGMGAQLTSSPVRFDDYGLGDVDGVREYLDGAGQIAGLGARLTGMGGGAGGFMGATGGMAPGMGGVDGLGPVSAGMGAGGTGLGGAQSENMVNVIADVLLRITEQGGGDDWHPRPVAEYAALPPQVTPPAPPGKKTDGRALVKRYVVVEDTGVFYDPASPLLSGQRGVSLDIAAQQLLDLGFKPAPDLSF